MAQFDGYPILALFKGVKTDTAATDAGQFDLPNSGKGIVFKGATVYNANGNNAVATLGLFTGAGATGVTVVADAALTGVTGPTIVSERTVAATGVSPVITADQLYARVGTASGVAGSTVDIVVYGYHLP